MDQTAAAGPCFLFNPFFRFIIQFDMQFKRRGEIVVRWMGAQRSPLGVITVITSSICRV